MYTEEFEWSLEISFVHWRMEVDVIIDYMVDIDEILVGNVRLKNKEYRWLQPAIDKLNLEHDHEHLVSMIDRHLKAVKQSEIEAGYM